MGVKTGEWLYFQEDGKPSKTLNYEDNVFNGLQSYFHKNGKPQKQINIKRGFRWRLHYLL